MSHPYVIVDVFTQMPLQGNPLAVVLDADDLDSGRMQAIAREFNLSETVFVVTPRDIVKSARIRIFTPTRELPFAGHPTVGAAAVLAERRAPEIIARQDLSVVIEEEIGTVDCTVRRLNGVTRASFTLPRLPTLEPGAPSREATALALGLTPDDLDADMAPVVASAGNPFVIVPLRDRDAARRATPDLARMTDTFGDRGVYIVTSDTEAMDAQLHARMFAPRFGATEDPATGSAAAALAAVLARHEAFGDGDYTVVIEQGLEMGRPSLITLGMTIEAGTLTGGSIGGAAVVVADGTLRA